MEPAQRLRIFFERLAAAPPAASAQEALALVCRLIQEVEEEFCLLPRQEPAPRQPAGRMYPPQADMIRTLPDGVIQARTIGHMIYCRPDGSIAICRRKSSLPSLEKTGAQL